MRSRSRVTSHLLRIGSPLVALALGATLLAGPASAATGPYLVKDIMAGHNSSNPTELTAMGGKLYFSAKGGGKGRELWVSDGSGPGTQRVMDIRPGGASSSPYSLVAVGSMLYFVADDGVTGRELWVTDGTSPGTQRLTDNDPGTVDYASPVGLTAVEDELFFFVKNADDRLELWKTDGSSLGTVRVKVLFQYAGLMEHPAAFGGRLFFGLGYCCPYSGHSFGKGLWVSNGTAKGTKHFFSAADESFPAGITSAGGRLYWNDDIHGLYRSNGTPGATKSMGGILAIAYLIEFRGVLYFNGSDDGYASHGDLWTSNGTAAGTTMVKEMSSGARSLTLVGNLLFFSSLAANDDPELWVSDGTTAGTKLLMTGWAYQPLGDLVDVDGTLYFNAFNSLYTSDGTVEGTVLVHDGIGGASKFTSVGGSVFYVSGGPDNQYGTELWRYVP